MCIFIAGGSISASEIIEPSAAGTFYPVESRELSREIMDLLQKSSPVPVKGKIMALISPHAGYQFSGATAAFGYSLIKDKPYKTVVIIGTSHRYGFNGISVYPNGIFRTPLGDLKVDEEFALKLLRKKGEFFFDPRAFDREHSVEVQLPFLQKTLTGFRIVPVIIGRVDFETCRDFGLLLAETIGKREDVLLIASTDMYHGYDYTEAEIYDNNTLSYIKNLDSRGLYSALEKGTAQLCGGFSVVSVLIAAGKLGDSKATVLYYTNSAEVTKKPVKGTWTVGYSSCVISQKKGDSYMLNQDQRKKLLEIARNSILTYLETGKKLEVTETDPVFLREMGAFVTLRKKGQLRGCIGNLVGEQPLYLTVRDMAVEAAVEDPRFPAVESSELSDIDIEISVLTPLQKVDSADDIQMGVHGVMVKSGYRGGVYLPQVAIETGWGKEEFLSSLCAHKAGLDPDAWKDPSTQLYVFTAEILSEKNDLINEK